MSFPRESELNFGVNPAVGTLQPGSPVRIRTRDELDQVAQELGTKLITDDNGDTYLLVDPFSRHYFDDQGRIVRLERTIKAPVRRGYDSRPWNYVEPWQDYGVERRVFAYDEQGRLEAIRILRSTTGAFGILWITKDLSIQMILTQWYNLLQKDLCYKVAFLNFRIIVPSYALYH